VPRVVGLVVGKARTKITRAHCRLGSVTAKASNPRAKGKVLAQSPKPGKTLKKGARVNLTVGKGPVKKKR
jgi:beta-lactam-binding protein with PASTA domain